jgi:two-component system chemotaxis sensor kinase CheA
MDEAIQTFIEESNDLLHQMEDALQSIDLDAGSTVDEDIVNAIFRAAHTIKGTAGLFGLDHIVEFTHVAESVLDCVRDGELALSKDLVLLFLECRDHIGDMIELVADGEKPLEGSGDNGSGLKKSLNSYLNKNREEEGEQTLSSRTLVEGQSPVNPLDGTEVVTDNWHISLRFSLNVLRDGMDPMSFIRYLDTLGKVVYIVTLSDALPGADEFDPESCYLGFEISFDSDSDKAEIEAVFEFVRDDCRLRILPPHSRIEHYIELIDELPEEEMRVGEILMRCGSLTENELQMALAKQAAADGSTLQPLGSVLMEEKLVEPVVVEAALEKQKKIKENKIGENALIRVDANKLEQLIDLVGELIIAGASVNLIAHRSNMSDLVEATTAMSRLVEDVRDSALNLRMVQIGATFNRFRRVVREVSKELGKEIDLEINGADTELDKTVVEKIGDPLTHLVRNSMDHGIEPADLRLASGKSVKGKVRLNAYHDSGSIVIEVSDDGRGLNKEKILQKAIERGVVGDGHGLSENEICNLIFEPGFSTADAVSNLSGRGVGMDVVRRNIQALRGTVELDSTEGVGSTVRIRLPLTLAIIDGFLVGVGDATYVIPLDMVDECIEHAAWTNDACEGNYLNLRGEVLPYLRLREMFGIQGEMVRRENVVVVRHGSRKAGLVVDRLLGEFQTVIKPLGRVFANAHGISGSTILGSGEVALIFDIPNLLQRVSSEQAGRAA